MNFGLLIGLVSGLISFVPYVGSLTGLVLSLGVAIAQFWPEWTPIIVVAGIFFVGQFLEGYVLSPKLVGESIGLHPVWLMFALFAFGYLFGFVGMLLAVPLAAASGVLVRFALRQYLASPLYTGAEPPALAMTPRQLALDLPHETSFAREDFLQGPRTPPHWPWSSRWPDWPARVVALVGPEGSGKSHLAAIWADCPARASCPPVRSASRICRRRSRPARWSSRTSPPSRSRSAPCSTSSISLASTRLMC